ncbi:hypothetical protein GF371_02600 [Candidatus Woesearchaeota archaeon]|nr:hypothetical protein [Candidatus Woesearchaeota archaeon]
MPEWTVYAHNKTFYAFEDGKLIDACRIRKKKGHGLVRYDRAENLMLREEEVERVLNSLGEMKQIACFSGPYLFDRSQGMHFDGLAQKVDEAGEIFVTERLSIEEVEASRAAAQNALAEAQSYASLGGTFRQNARHCAQEGLKYDPQNQELKKLLERME